MRFGIRMLGMIGILFGACGIAEGCTSSVGRRYQGYAADSREKRRRTSRSKTQGDSRTYRAVHD
jgi:hypothetical protein